MISIKLDGHIPRIHSNFDLKKQTKKTVIVYVLPSSRRNLLWRRWCNNWEWRWASSPNPRSYATATRPCASCDRRRRRSSRRRRKRRRRPRRPTLWTPRTKQKGSPRRRSVTRQKTSLVCRRDFTHSAIRRHVFGGRQRSAGAQKLYFFWRHEKDSLLQKNSSRRLESSFVSRAKMFLTWRCIKHDRKKWVWCVFLILFFFFYFCENVHTTLTWAVKNAGHCHSFFCHFF